MRRKYTGKLDNGRRRPYSQELDENETMFVNFYFEYGLDVTRALRDAGYSWAVKHPWEVMRRPHVQQAIFERLQYENLGAAELLQMVASLARGDIRNYVRVEEWEETVTDIAEDGTTVEHTETRYRVLPDLFEALKSGNTYALKSVEWNRDGTVKKLVLDDRFEAIRLIGAALGMFGLDKNNENDGISFKERMRNIDPRVVVEELAKIAKSYGIDVTTLAMPKLSEPLDVSHAGVEYDGQSSLVPSE